MIERVRAMPGGIRLFLVYALLILTGLGLSLRFVVDQAIAAPIFVAALGVLLFRGLLRPEVRLYLNEV